MNPIKKKCLALGIASALAVSVSGSLQAQETEKYSLNINSQAADSALFELGRQAGAEIMLKQGLDASVQLPALQGDYTLQSALDQMLKDSGLIYNLTADGLVIIEQEEDGAEGKKEVDEEVVVTGSRIRNVSPTGNVKIITRDEFEKLGVNSAEDIIRTLPQNFSAINSGSTTTGQGNNTTPFGTIGQSAANLRGLGSNATLVLVNGRRIAGSPNYEGDGTINLTTIPTAAIERVEILLEGASAIYGSDALGGVINFILRSDWQGGETQVRYEKNRNGGDNKYLSQVLGTSWSSGKVTATLSYEKTEGVDLRKAGYDTRDYRPLGGSDRRTQLFGFFGPSGNAYNNPGYILGLGALPDGIGPDWTEADISLDNAEPYDSGQHISSATPTSEITTATINFNQELSESIELFGDMLYSKNKNVQIFGPVVAGSFFGGALVPASNPFNNLDRDVEISFIFDQEDFGVMSDDSSLERININLGANIELNDNWQLSVTGSFGEEDGIGVEGPQLSGQAYEEALAGFRLDDMGNPILSEPVPALNYFTGEHDPDVDFFSLLTRVTDGFGDSHTVSQNQGLEAVANGTVFSIAGGDVSLAIGVNLRQESYDLSENAFSRLVNNLALEDSVLERDVYAAYFEASVPLIGEGNQLPGVEQLLFTLAGRYEEYTMEYRFDGAGLPRTEKNFNQFSPKIGMRWEPISDLAIRFSWTESFRAPSLLELGEPPTSWGRDLFDDLDHPSGIVPTVYEVDLFRAGNPNLQPETADSLSLGFDWSPAFLDGLTVSGNYTEIDWTDKIQIVRPWDVRLGSNTAEFPDVFVRGADGFLTTVTQRPINLATSYTEVIDLTVGYEFDTDVGLFSVELTGVYTKEASDSIFDEPPQDNVETDFGPDQLVLKAIFGWNAGDYGMNLISNYSSSYDYTEFGRFILTGQPFPRIAHYTSIDMTGFYNMDGGWEFKAGMRNVLNNNFPFIDSFRQPYDPQRVDTRGRVVYLDVSKSFDL